MKKNGKMTVKAAALLITLGLLAAGCATQAGKTTGSYYENRRFVPRIHVDDISFGSQSQEYRGCSYDHLNEGYWCPVDR